MKMLWRLSREAIRYRTLYVIAILATLGLTAVNLGAPTSWWPWEAAMPA